MQPKLELLSGGLVERILVEAFQIIDQTGVKVQHTEALDLLSGAGCRTDQDTGVVRIPEQVVRAALASVPREFWLYNANGEKSVHYGGDDVHFDPGSSGVNILDPETLEHRPAVTGDLVRIIQLAEVLPQIDAQSTAVVCSDVPKEIGDLYRLYLVLLHSEKPVVTGAFSSFGAQAMFDLLAVCSGSRTALAQKPRAVFDVCPTPPLIWSHFACQNLIDLARTGVPAEIISMPLAGAGSPVTLLGSVVQHAAETLSGIAIHQLAKPGSPVVWGGAPAVFDMRTGTTPMGAVETAMIDCGYAQVGKHLGLPTHTYLGASDAKSVDAQAGMESGMTALTGALAGINMISGAGMLDFLACFSPEKLLIDAEGIGMVKRLLRGIETHTPTLALEMFADFRFKADFLKQKATRDLFQKEQYLPSPVIDRGSLRLWQDAGMPDAFERARRGVDTALKKYRRPELAPEVERELAAYVQRLAEQAGMDVLPEIPGIITV